MKNYPTELIQVASVALAAWEDFMAGKADATLPALSEAQAKVYAERRRFAAGVTEIECHRAQSAGPAG